MSFINLLGAGQAEWITNTFPVFKGILIGVLAVCAVAIIILVLCQQSNSQGGINGVTGSNVETYYAHNKGSTKEGRLKKATTITAIIGACVTVLYFILALVV